MNPKTSPVRNNPLLELMWNRMNRDDMNLVAAIVADTGAGKSLTTASLCKVLDPGYEASDVCWHPLEVLEKAKNTGKYGQGDMISFEEGGVNADARSYWKAMNKALDTVFQTWREQNRGLILNMPSLDLLDKRIRKRLHYLFIVQRRTPDYVVLKVLRVKESKTSGDLSFHYPIVDVDGEPKKIKFLRVAKPPEAFIEEFKKDEKEFKRGLIEDKYAELKEELDDSEISAKEAAEEILDDDIFDRFVRKNGSQRYLDKSGIFQEFKDKGLKKADLDSVKSILYQRKDLHEKDNWV